uniref:CSON002946 protein n=1 Tax=Culicoides sonorensis TaxID=179676 RepID=A0A336LM57_CULSO
MIEWSDQVRNLNLVYMSSSYMELVNYFVEMKTIRLILNTVQAHMKKLEIFGHLDERIIEDIIYVNWLSLIQIGVVALEFYNTQLKNWLQAHALARFVIMKVLVEAGEDLLSVEETVSNNNLLIKLTLIEDGPQPWLKWREIVLKHKQPRIIFVQGNTQIGEDRFPNTKVDDILENLWTADKHYFAKH